MIYNLNNITGSRITSSLEHKLLAQSAKGEKDIFDFDLKSVQLGSAQPRGIVTSKFICTATCSCNGCTRSGHSFCCTSKG